jgi:hypothetical protein
MASLGTWSNFWAKKYSPAHYIIKRNLSDLPTEAKIRDMPNKVNQTNGDLTNDCKSDADV